MIEAFIVVYLSNQVAVVRNHFPYAECLPFTEPERGVCSVYLIHLPDHSCSSPAAVVGSYLITSYRRMLSLTPLFCNSPETQSSSNYNLPTIHTRTLANRDQQRAADVDSSYSAGDCAICLSAPAMCAFIPCRHCMCCIDCVRQLSYCPMCRSVIIAYFRT